METQVFFQNNFLFGNEFLESIPHPNNGFGFFLSILSLICHFIGGDKFFIFLLPFLYFCYNRKFGIKLGLALLSSGFVNGILKYIFESPRPTGLSIEIINSQLNLIKEISYGFPSGHSQVSILVWGILFLEFKNKFFRILCIGIIILTPFTRLYTGMHFVGDVIGGFFIGIINLYLIENLFLKFPNLLEISFSEVTKKKYFRTIFLSLLAITLSTILLKPNGTKMSSASISQIITCAGSFFGSIIGFLVLEIFYKEIKWEIVNSWKDFSKRASILILSILIFYFGLSFIGAKLDFEETIFRYFKYACLNFSLVAISPILYYKWK